ncbi:MAG: hypothetical protein R6U98_17715 [Pirellulaceae bacterium]
MAVLASTAVRDASAQRRCDRCGSGNGHKICRLVRDTKEVEVTCWDSQCEDSCLPGPCKMGRRLSEKVRGCGADGCRDGGCASAGNGGSRGGGKWFVWRMTTPGCARIFTKKNLMKKTVTKEVCVYKWKIENLCSACNAECKPVEVPKDAAVPPPPDTDALILDPHAAPKPVHLSVAD